MDKATAAALITALEWYGWLGLGVAALFLSVGIGRIDRSARGAYAARIALIPGVVALWPAVLFRWIQLELAKEPL